MYDAEVTADRTARVEEHFNFSLTRYSVAEVAEFRDRLQNAWDDKGADLRALSTEELRFVQNEILFGKVDFSYWAERYCYVNLAGADVGPLYPLWESQRLILEKIAELERRTYFDDHPDGILVNILKARQLGASTLAEAMLAHRITTQSNIFGLIAADVPEQSGFTFDMLERVVEYLPRYLLPTKTDHVKNAEIAFDTGSHIWVGSGKSIRGVEQRRGQLGRGKSLSCVHLTELSTWESTEQIDAALMPTIHIHPQALVLFESTAKGRNNWWHHHWKSSKAGIGRFTPVFIPWYAERSRYWLPAPPQWMPAPDTLAHARRCEETGPRWVGKDVRLTRNQLYWYETTRDTYKEKGQLHVFLEEMASDDEEAFQHSGYGIFSLEVIEKLREVARPMAAAFRITRPFGTIGGEAPPPGV